MKPYFAPETVEATATYTLDGRDEADKTTMLMTACSTTVASTSGSLKLPLRISTMQVVVEFQDKGDEAQ